MTKTITIIVEYENEVDIPLFHANMKVQIGPGALGRIVAVAFTDILKELERRHE